MNPFGNKSENRQKTFEVSPEDVEAINVRRPIRHKAYSELYKAATSEPAQLPVNALGSFSLADKGYVNPQANKLNDQQAMQEAYRNLGILGNEVEAEL